jgi:hypothetical protein
MCLGVWHDALIARIGPAAYESALAQPHVRPFDITGRPMKGWVLVEAEGIERDSDLRRWAERAVQFVGQLPAK